MATTKKRINVSISRDVEQALARLAKRDELPQATKAGELIRLALELEEDQVLEQIAGKRDKERASFVSHKKAWA